MLVSIVWFLFVSVDKTAGDQIVLAKYTNLFLCLSIQENDFCTEKNFSFSLRMVLVYRVIDPFMDFLFDKKISFLVNWIRVNQQQ